LPYSFVWSGVVPVGAQVHFCVELLGFTPFPVGEVEAEQPVNLPPPVLLLEPVAELVEPEAPVVPTLPLELVELFAEAFPFPWLSEEAPGLDEGALAD
jgi:hypothetical protein